MGSLIEQGFGVTSKGFNRPNLYNLIDRTEGLFKQTDNFGEDFSFETDKVLFQLSSVWLNNLADLFEILEQVYLNSTPLEAQGNSLFKKGSFVGMPRKQASRAKTQVIINGEIGTQIPTGQLLKTPSGIIFIVENGGTISSGNSITLDVVSQKVGDIGNVEANSITQFVTPIQGTTSVTNPNASTGGQEQENELQFRTRYYQRFDEGFGTNVDGIASSIKEISGVRDALVYENDTDVEVEGVPAHSISPFVWGGNNNDIANKIFDVKAAAIRSFGNITIPVKDTQDFTHQIGFTRPNEVDIYIKLTIEKTADYPIDGDDKVKESVLKYIDSLGLGSTVYPYQISSSIANLNIRGINNIVVELSKDGTTYITQPIAIQKNEVAITDENKVIIQ